MAILQATYYIVGSLAAILALWEFSKKYKWREKLAHWGIWPMKAKGAIASATPRNLQTGAYVALLVVGLTLIGIAISRDVSGVNELEALQWKVGQLRDELAQKDAKIAELENRLKREGLVQTWGFTEGGSYHAVVRGNRLSQYRDTNKIALSCRPFDPAIEWSQDLGHAELSNFFNIADDDIRIETRFTEPMRARLKLFNQIECVLVLVPKIERIVGAQVKTIPLVSMRSSSTAYMAEKLRKRK